MFYTWDNMRKIEKYLACHEGGKTNDIAVHLQLIPERIRAILTEMEVSKAWA